MSHRVPALTATTHARVAVVRSAKGSTSVLCPCSWGHECTNPTVCGL